MQFPKERRSCAEKSDSVPDHHIPSNLHRALTFSLRDNLDLSTPSGLLTFALIDAMAEFERALIQERVKAEPRNARAKDKRLGRPRVFVSDSRIESLRAFGAFLQKPPRPS